VPAGTAVHARHGFRPGSADRKSAADYFSC